MIARAAREVGDVSALVVGITFLTLLNVFVTWGRYRRRWRAEDGLRGEDWLPGDPL